MASMQDERASEAQPATATGAAATAADGPRPAAAASLPPFALERFFARWEFKAKHLLCCSDRWGN